MKIIRSSIILLIALLCSCTTVPQTSQIQAVDVTGMNLPQAIETLQRLGFENIETPNVEPDSDTAKYKVVQQSVSPGDSMDPASKLVLDCAYMQSYRVYLDISSEIHPFATKGNYDLDILFGDREVNILPSGYWMTYLLEDIAEGDYELAIQQTGNPNMRLVKTLHVHGDMSFGCYVKHDKESMSMENTYVEDGISRHELLVPDVTDMVLSEAVATLESIGFKSIHPSADRTIIDYDNWIVVSQSLVPGTRKDQRKRFELQCIRLSEYSQQLPNSSY